MEIIEKELWTNKQRQANSIHEISYRACFKAELPRFFIELFTNEGDTVYDPFAGRGTTAIEASLLKRKIISNDINPLSKILTEPRLNIPSLESICQRLAAIPIIDMWADIDLSMFYNPDTEKELVSIMYFLDYGAGDAINNWIRMVATNRLTGHSSGYFSGRTLPPNQAVSQASQIAINKKLGVTTPPYKNTKDLIIKKSKSLMKDITDDIRGNLLHLSTDARFLSMPSMHTPTILSDSVDFIITSPPFIDVIDYAGDNWLRCYFNDIDIKSIGITTPRSISDWEIFMSNTLMELKRVTKPNKYIAIEVGDVKKFNLVDTVIRVGNSVGLLPEYLYVNKQNFTKTASIWGIDSKKGVNTNNVILFKKL